LAHLPAGTSAGGVIIMQRLDAPSSQVRA